MFSVPNNSSMGNYLLHHFWRSIHEDQDVHFAAFVDQVDASVLEGSQSAGQRIRQVVKVQLSAVIKDARLS